MALPARSRVTGSGRRLPPRHARMCGKLAAVVGLSLEPHQPPPPPPPRPFQRSVHLVQFRLKSRLVGMQFGMFVGQSLQFIERAGHIARHAQHVRPGCSGTTSFLSCCKAMVQWHQRRPVKTAVDPEELARRYRDGASPDDLGVLCGCSGQAHSSHPGRPRCRDPATRVQQRLPAEQVYVSLKQGALRCSTELTA
jgi:hypothetical protein